MDRHDRVLAIVLAAEHLLGLAGVDDARQLVEAAREILGDRLPGFGPFDEHGEIVGATSQRFAEIAVLLEPAPPLEQLLRGGLILPEVRIGDALFYRCEFFVRGGGRQR